MKVLVLNGPNLNLLGEREPEVYGNVTLPKLIAQVRSHAKRLGITIRASQTNHEGVLIDRIHAARKWMDALVINPGALTHTSYALRDAIAAVNVRAIEVHLSDIHAREPWRRESRIADVCEAQISGKGVGSYLEALERLSKPSTPAGRSH
ncbi:MAG: type II 3-dehydroquinate dehydratase [Myxococcaceae bacterium]